MDNKLKLTIADWNNGIWGNRVLYFKNLEEAKRQLRKEKGRVKIYNQNNQVIYSGDINNTESYA